jgi:hypothetical protein
LIACKEEVLKLKVSMKEARSVKLSEEKAGGSGDLSLEGKGFPKGMGAHFQQIVNEVLRRRDLQGKKVGPVEKRKYGSMNSANRLDRWDTTRSNLFSQRHFPE